MQLLEKFSKPENWDKCAEGTGYVMYCGCNDWENSPTAAAVVFPSDDGNRRIWFTIKFPENCQPDNGKTGGYKDDNRERCKKYSERAWRAWMRAARDAHKNRNHGSRSWKDAFKTALHSKEMQSFVKEHGEEATKWDDVKESLRKAPMDAKNLIARAGYKAQRLKAKGWKPGDFARVLVGGPSAQKGVHDEVQRRAAKAVEALLDDPDPEQYMADVDPTKLFDQRMRVNKFSLASPAVPKAEGTCSFRVVLMHSMSSSPACEEWVTHLENMDLGGKHWGNYTRDYNQALDDFKARCEKDGIDWSKSEVVEDD